MNQKRQNCTESECAEPLCVIPACEIKSTLKIATFRVSDWLRSATAWRVSMGLLITFRLQTWLLIRNREFPTYVTGWMLTSRQPHRVTSRRIAYSKFFYISWKHVTESQACWEIQRYNVKNQPSAYPSVHNNVLLFIYLYSVDIHQGNLLKSLVTMNRVTYYLIPRVHKGNCLSQN